MSHLSIVFRRGFGRVLVTGGAGFIGSNLVRRLLAESAVERVVVLDLLTYAGHEQTLADCLRDPRCELVVGDIADEQLVHDLFAREQFDSVYHLAAESHVDRSILDPGAFVRTNVIGSWALLEGARAAWSGDPKLTEKIFVHVSTDEVYGSLGSTGRFHEDTPYDPSSPYSASKASGDHFARAYQRTYGLPVLVTNCTNNYGAYQFPEKLIPVMINRALERRTLPIYGDGQQVRDWIHVSDHCEALVCAASSGTPGRTYNIGAHDERTNLQIVHGLCEVLGHRFGIPASRLERLVERVPDRPGHDRRYAVDASRIMVELGWCPRVSFEDGLRETVDFYLCEREGWVREVLQAAAADRARFERSNYELRRTTGSRAA